MRLSALALCVLALCVSAATDTDEEEEEDLVDLYTPRSKVAFLDHTNFEQEVRDKPYIWVVEFYNSWCGHCQLYAPTWNSFAQQTKDWASVVRVGAINCARAKNLAVCRNYEIDAYPWVRVFPPLSRKGDIGKHKTHHDANKMMDMVVNYVHEIQQKSHPPRWPYLDVFQGSLSEFLASPEPLHALVLESDANSTLGRSLVLDFWQHGRLRLARSLSPLPGLEVTETRRPLLITWRDGQRRNNFSRDGLPARSLFRRQLRDMLGMQEEHDPQLVVRDAVGKPPAPPAGEGVYMVDLENALSYALNHEVAGKKLISGEALSALREFLAALLEHLPGRDSVVRALRRIRDRLLERDQVSGEEVQALLETAALPRHRSWQGCRGSEPRYRGYPCSLWTLFHTITVRASETNPAGPSILPAIHGYVKHFFSCGHCSQHFQQMAAEEGLFNVTRANKAAVWLWRAHNMVNKRLSGDASEDPQRPKQQFPSRQQCRACFNGKQYVQVIVLAFLRSYYGAGVIKLDGLEGVSTPLQQPVQVEVVEAVVSPAAAAAASVPASPPVVLVWRRPVSFGAISEADVSLCVVLWVFSFLTLLLAFLLFRMKRRYKRKTSSLTFGPYP